MARRTDSPFSRDVIARCRNCGDVQRRKKGRSGLPHSKGGEYCGTMEVVRTISQISPSARVFDGKTYRELMRGYSLKEGATAVGWSPPTFKNKSDAACVAAKLRTAGVNTRVVKKAGGYRLYGRIATQASRYNRAASAAARKNLLREKEFPPAPPPALEQPAMTQESARRTHAHKQGFKKRMKIASEKARANLGNKRRLSAEEKRMIYAEQWKAEYAEELRRGELDPADVPSATFEKVYQLGSGGKITSDDLDPSFDLDPISGGQSQKRFKVDGEYKRFPLVAIGYNKDGKTTPLDEYAAALRDAGFYVRSASLSYDRNMAALRWGLFIHPKSPRKNENPITSVSTASNNPGGYVTRLFDQYTKNPDDPQFGAKLRSELALEIDYFDEYAPSLLVSNPQARWDDDFGEGPVASNVRIFNKHIPGHSGDWLDHAHRHDHYDPNEDFPSKPGHRHSHDGGKTASEKRRGR